MLNDNKITLEELNIFSSIYPKVKERACSLYRELDHLDGIYRTFKYSMDGMFSFDSFLPFGNGSILLNGSYGQIQKSYTISLPEFLDAEAYVARYEEEKKADLEEHAEAHRKLWEEHNK